MNQTSSYHIYMSSIHEKPREGELPEQLAPVDLNLLVAFDALARERNVTRAARRMGVTQSAMSHALRRLRELLDDPLLVRGRSGMVLTERAEYLVVPVRSGLVTLGRALAQRGRFDPTSARRTFSLTAPDLFDVLALPPLLERVRREAPDVNVTLVSEPGRQLAAHLETGEVDMAIVALLGDGHQEAPEPSSASLLRRTLFRDRFVCLLRADHPVLGGGRSSPKRTLSLQTFTKLEHALVSTSEGGPGLVDRVLAEQGLRRRVALRVPHFYSAAAIVARSELVLTAPAALGGLVEHLPLVMLAPPLRLPDHSVNLIWHARFSQDPGHRWLRDLLTETARAAQQEAAASLTETP